MVGNKDIGGLQACQIEGFAGSGTNNAVLLVFLAQLDRAEYHCYSTMTLCWGAQAALYHYYGVNKTVLPAKMFGIFPYGLTVKNHPLMRGFDDRYFIPQSRHTAVDDDAIDACKALQVLSRSVENGINICATKDFRRIFVLGHFEYDRYTLANEFYRDKQKNLPTGRPPTSLLFSIFAKRAATLWLPPPFTVAPLT